MFLTLFAILFSWLVQEATSHLHFNYSHLIVFAYNVEVIVQTQFVSLGISRPFNRCGEWTNVRALSCLVVIAVPKRKGRDGGKKNLYKSISSTCLSGSLSPHVEEQK